MEKQQLEALLKEMSLEEKVGQLFQIIGYYYVEEGKMVFIPWITSIIKRRGT